MTDLHLTVDELRAIDKALPLAASVCDDSAKQCDDLRLPEDAEMCRETAIALRALADRIGQHLASIGVPLIA